MGIDYSSFDNAVKSNKKPIDFSSFDKIVKKKEESNPSNDGSEIPIVSLDKSELETPLQLNRDNFNNYVLNPASTVNKPVKPTIQSLDVIEKKQFIDQNGYFKPQKEQEDIIATIVAQRNNPVAQYNKGKSFLEQDIDNNTKLDNFTSYVLNPASINQKTPEDIKKDILDEGEAEIDGKIPSIAYTNTRKAQIDQQIADLKHQQYISKPQAGRQAGVNIVRTENFNELQSKIDELEAYKLQLVNNTEPIAKVQVFKATKESPVDPNNPSSQLYNHWGDIIGTRTPQETQYMNVGMNYTSLFDPITVENKKKNMEDGGDRKRGSDIVSIENYGYEKQGIITSIEALDILHSQGKVTPDQYESERGKLLQSYNGLEKKYPVVRMQNIKGALGQILDENRDIENNVTNTPLAGNIGGLKSLWQNIINTGYSDSEVNKAIKQLNDKGANITKSEAEFLINNKSDIGNTSLLGRAIGGTVKLENKLEATAGLQSDASYETTKILLENRFANTPNKATEQPQTIISTEGDVMSNPDFLQPVKNPDAGLHNWGWGTVNLVADGVGTLAKLYALTELTGGLADELVGGVAGTEVVGYAAAPRIGQLVEQTALSAAQRQTIGTIAGMYLDTYQDAKDAAKTFIGDKEGGEQAREMYANLMGLANGVAWTILPANKIVQDITAKASISGAEDFAKLIPAEGIAGLKENTVADFLTNTLKETAKAQGKITGISALTQIGQYAAQAMYNPQSVESRNLGQEITDGALQGLSFLPITLLEGRGLAKNVENVNEFTKEAIYRVASDPVAFKNYTENEVANGNITQQEANAKVQLINTMFDIRKEVPTDLTKQEKVEYANNLLFTRKLHQENETIKDPVQTKINDNKILELEKRRQEILDNSTGKIPTKEEGKGTQVVDLTPAEIVGSLKDNPNVPEFEFKAMQADPENALKGIADQALGFGRDANTGERLPLHENANEPQMEAAVRKYGKDVVDEAIKKYPKEDIVSKSDNIQPVTMDSVIGGIGTYKGIDGYFRQEGQRLIFFENNDTRSHDLGNVDEIKNQGIKDFEVTYKPSKVSINNADNIVVDGKAYSIKDEGNRLASIKTGQDGNVESVYLKDENGHKQIFKGQVAEDIAYQIHLKELNKDNETANKFEQFVESSEPIKSEILAAENETATQKTTTENNATVSGENINPNLTVENFADRIASGEKITSPEDLQFYENNKPEIEAALKEKASKENTSSSKTKKNENKSNEDNELQGEGTKGQLNGGSQSGQVQSEDASQRQSQVKEVVNSTASDNKGAVPTTKPETKEGKFEAKARKLAEKIQAAELPDWLKIDDANAKKSGIGSDELKKALADATIKMGKLLDKGVEFAEAVKEAVKDIVDLVGEGMRSKIEEGFAKDYKQNSEDADFTGTRKEKLREIAGAKELFEKRGKKKWSEIYQSALENIQKMYPNKSLYEGMKTRVREMVLKLNNKELYNPTSEDIAVFNVLRAETHKRIDGVEGLDSDNSIVRQTAIAELENLNNDLFDIARVTNPNGEAGRAFGMLQSEINTNNGLKIRRMQLMKAKGGEPLTEAEIKWTEQKWEQEKALMKQEEYQRTQKMQEEFEAKISDLQKEYEQKLKEAVSSSKNKSTKEKTLSQSGKDIADKIRKLKLTGAKVDFTFGGWNVAVEGIAKLVEGGATVAEAIDKLINDGIIGFRNINDRDNFESHLSERINKKTPDETIEKIKDFSKEKDVTDITDEMVSKNLIRDFVNSHIGEVDKKELLNDSFNKLKEVLPNISKDRFVEAYLKEGEFKQPTQRQLENGIKEQEAELKRIAKQELTADQKQKIQLARDKENAISKTREFKRKLDNGEFEEPIPTKLKKADAELIRLKKEQSIIEEQYRKKQQELHEKNKHWLERAADLIRSSYVALLIGRPLTLAKVAAMSVLRPISEASTKLTFGKVFDAFFPNISKAALGGGEGTSMRSIQKGFQAYFAQMGEKKLEDKYQKANNDYESALKKYNDYKQTNNADKKILENLKNDVNNKLIKATGSFIYKFIGGSSIKDALTALVYRSNEIEKQFGKVEGEKFDTKDFGNVGGGSFLGLGADNARYILDFIGRSHSAAKTFSGRYSFASSFMSRLEGAVKNGEGISSADKILEIAHESYLDWERGKYQQSNAISDLWNKVVNNISKGETEKSKITTAKAMETLLKGDVAITRVPVNILHESVMEYTLGAFRAAVMAYKATSKAKGELKSEGIEVSSPEFKEALKERISQMDSKQAATIARAFRKGGLGAGLYALALISGAIHFGIFPHLGQKKKKEEEDLKPGELNPGDIVVGDTKLNHNVSSIVEHIPALWPMFMGLGMAQAYKDEINNGKTTTEAVVKSIKTHLQIIEGGIPQTQIVSPSRVAGKVFDITKKRLTDSGVIDSDKTIFTNEEVKNNDNIKLLKEKGIEFKPPTASEHKVDIDEQHPNGKMMAEELDKFKGIVKDVYLNGVEEIKGEDGNEAIPSMDDLLDATYTVTVKHKDGTTSTETAQGKDLPEDNLKTLVQSWKEKATKYAEKELGLKTPKEKTTVTKNSNN